MRARVRMLGWRCVAEFGAAMRSPSVARLVCCRASEGRATRFYLVMNKKCHYVQVQVTREHSGDVLLAFDNMSGEVMCAAMSAAGIHTHLIAAFLVESVDLLVSASISGVQSSGGIRFSKCARQGGIESSWIWELVMRFILAPIVRFWNPRGLGVLLEVDFGYTLEDILTTSSGLTAFGCSARLSWPCRSCSQS